MSKEMIEITRIIKELYDLDISKYDDMFIMRAVEKRYTTMKSRDSSDYTKYLSCNTDEAAILLQSLNITHTEFFRNPLTFAHLEQWILPRLIEEKPENRELRIWSAGCSSGQEAYSIAIQIENIISRNYKKKRYRIIATDISESALTIAKKGEYREKDIENIRLKDLKEFFYKTGEVYKVSDRLKQNITFSFYNLLDNSSSYPQESIFGDFDLVICSNMLYYYKPDYQLSILQKLINSMDEQGYLITSESERQSVEKINELYLVVPPSPIFKQRRGLK